MCYTLVHMGYGNHTMLLGAVELPVHAAAFWLCVCGTHTGKGQR